MESFPLFVVGSPRSGTTFLCSVLNMHPQIQLTNECRVFTLMKEMIDVGANRPDLLGVAYRDRFRDLSRRTRASFTSIAIQATWRIR